MSENSEKITAKVILEYQKAALKLKTIGDWKALGNELVNRYNITVKEALDILQRRSDKIIKILAKYE